MHERRRRSSSRSRAKTRMNRTRRARETARRPRSPDRVRAKRRRKRTPHAAPFSPTCYGDVRDDASRRSSSNPASCTCTTRRTSGVCDIGRYPHGIDDARAEAIRRRLPRVIEYLQRRRVPRRSWRRKYAKLLTNSHQRASKPQPAAPHSRSPLARNAHVPKHSAVFAAAGIVDDAREQMRAGSA